MARRSDLSSSKPISLGSFKEAFGERIFCGEIKHYAQVAAGGI
ncbi:MAG: hypothetical protein ACI9WS_002225 [Paraglaciecola psychrophila]